MRKPGPHAADCLRPMAPGRRQAPPIRRVGSQAAGAVPPGAQDNARPPRRDHRFTSRFHAPSHPPDPPCARQGALLPFTAAQATDTPPPGPQAEFAFEEVVTLAATVQVGRTAQGHSQYVPITGGRFEGPKIKGRVLPGGWDWQLARPDGHMDLDASYMIQASSTSATAARCSSAPTAASTSRRRPTSTPRSGRTSGSAKAASSARWARRPRVKVRRCGFASTG